MTTLYGYVSNQGAPEYDDIMQSDLSPEEKVKQIKIRGQAYRDELDAQLRKDLAKQYAGAALEIGSAAIPIGAGARLAGLAGKGLSAGGKYLLSSGLSGGLSGGVFGFGRGLMEDENPFLTAGQDAFWGGLGGLGLGALTNPQRIMKPGFFIGSGAFNAPQGKLMEAKQMAMYGDSNADIRNATGWFKGVDDKWRYEMPDGSLIENPNLWETKNTGFSEYQIAKLGDIYDNPELYQAYPKLKDLSVMKSDLPDGVDGMSRPNSIHIDNSLYSKHNPDYYEKLNKLKQTPEVKRLDELVKEASKNGYSEKLENEYNSILSNTENGKLYNSLVFEHSIPQKVEGWDDDALNTFIHEIQHQIQDIEGFAKGGNPTFNSNYNNLAGEVEARLAGARAKLTPEQRQIYNPANESTFLSNYGYDVLPEKQIVEFRSTPANSLNYRNEWVKIDGKDYRILNLPKKDYGKILHIVDTYLKPDDMIGEVIRKTDDLYEYTFQKVSPIDYKFIKRRKIK